MLSKAFSASTVSLYCLFALCLFPFIQPYHNAPWNSFYTEWIALFLGSFAIFFFLLIPRKVLWIPRISVWLTVLGFFVLLYPLFRTTPFIEQYVVAFFYFFWAACLIWISRNLLFDFEFLEFIANAIILGAIINVGICVYQSVTIGYVTGAMSQPNHTANYICLGFVSSTYLFLRNKMPLWSWALAISLFAYTLGLTSSRSVFLYCFAFFIIACYFLVQRRDFALNLLLITLVFLTETIFFSYNALQRVQVEATTVVTPVVSSDNLRIFLWVQAWELFKTSPLIGIGFGNFYVDLHREFAGHSHNLILNLLAETGIIGLLLFLIAMFSWSRKLIMISIGQWFVFGCLSVIFIHSMLEFPLWYANFLGLTAILFSMANTGFFSLRQTVITRTLSLVIAPLMILALCYAFFQYREIEQQTNGISFSTTPTGEGQQEIKTPEGSGISIRIVKP